MATSWPIEMPEIEERTYAPPRFCPYVDLAITTKDERYENGDTPENAGLRVYFHVVPVIDQWGAESVAIVGGEVATTANHAKGWRPPKREETINYDTSDWHGPATTTLRASIPEAIREKMIAATRAIHGPHNTTDECCRRRAEKGGEFTMPAPGIPTASRAFRE